MAELEIHHSHPWDLAPRQAYQLQDNLRQWVDFQPLTLSSIHCVCGVDAAYHQGSVWASAVVLSFPSLEIIEQTSVQVSQTYPYLPGLLSFRELPPILAALEQLNDLPDVIITDGHGWAHPRRFGLACHLGVLLDRPVIGCAKSLLCGEIEEPPQEAGCFTPIRLDDAILGAALRTRRGIKPVFVSVGHQVDLPSAITLVMRCVRKYRLPEPIRLAHHLTVKEKTQV